MAASQTGEVLEQNYATDGGSEGYIKFICIISLGYSDKICDFSLFLAAILDFTPNILSVCNQCISNLFLNSENI